MKKFFCLFVVALVVFTFSACGYGSAYKMSKCKHQFETTTIEATCTEEGKVIRKCPLCGFTVTTAIKMEDHKAETDSKGNPIKYDGCKSPTCTEWGYDVFHCSVCGEEFIKTIAPTNHSYKDHICTRCGAADKPIFFTDLDDDSMSSSDYRKFKATIHNYTGKTIEFVKVKLELFDANGKVVDTDWTYAVGSEGLKDRATAYFDIIYHGLRYGIDYKSWSISVMEYD